jgi:hypothetical protein
MFLTAEPARPRRQVAWGAMAVLAALALLGQATLHWRTEIAVLLPQAREPLAAACEFLGLELQLPRRPELMSIESSDLQAENPAQGLIVLNAVLRNRAPFPQEYPNLELTLTDERDQALVRRVLRPQEYLPALAGARHAQGMAAGAESVLRVTLDAGALRAVGYRLYLFFP